MKVTLTVEEHAKLVELYRRAENTPVIALTTEAALHGRDFASLAWDEVKSYMDELAKKYGYRPETAKISIASREFEASEVQ